MNNTERAQLILLLRKWLVSLEEEVAHGRQLYLGMTLLNSRASLKMRRAVGLPDVSGLLVRSVALSSRAEELGFLKGDLFRVEPDTSKLGIGVTVVALAIMPVLSRAKRKNANLASNRALAADAIQSATCAYLAALTLLGLVLNATLHIRWLDPLAAFVAIPIIVIEARRAIRGEVCGLLVTGSEHRNTRRTTE